MKTTTQSLHDNGFFDNYAKADKVLADFSIVTRSTVDEEKVNDDENQ